MNNNDATVLTIINHITNIHGSRTIRRRTIRRRQFGVGQFGADNWAREFVSDNSAQNMILILWKIPLSFSNILIINPASISARFSSPIPLLFQQYFFINPASISAIFFSPIPFGTRHYELGLLIDEKIFLKWKRD